ncbi:protein SON-like, partial [Limulus polyphemus]|uniref:Protein SON-like n=1 Tax=Limulus polyphemus TaxID=6850 RepID=A0ABM1RY32_LIMPO
MSDEMTSNTDQSSDKGHQEKLNCDVVTVVMETGNDRKKQSVVNSLTIPSYILSTADQGISEETVIRVGVDDDSPTTKVKKQRRNKDHCDLRRSFTTNEIHSLETNNTTECSKQQLQKKDYLCLPPVYTPAGHDQFRRHSMEIPSEQVPLKKGQRKRSCPETEFYRLDCLSRSSLRSNASGHSRRSSSASNRRRRHSRTPRGSITTPSRKSSRASRGSVTTNEASRRSSKASRESDATYQNPSRRSSRASRDSNSFMDVSRRPSQSPRGSVGSGSSSRQHIRTPRRSLDEQEVKEDENEPESRRRRIIIGIICSVFFFILITSIVLVAATLNLSTRIDQL